MILSFSQECERFFPPLKALYRLMIDFSQDVVKRSIIMIIYRTLGQDDCHSFSVFTSFFSFFDMITKIYPL